MDPASAANAPVVDLPLAPRGADGRVRFSGDFVLLKPVDLRRGNRRLLYDVNNRGNLYMLRHFNDAVGSNDPTGPEHAGNGFLMTHGFNHRFAQTTHHPSDLEGNSMPADHPPFNYLPEGSAPDNDVLTCATT